VQWKIMNVGEAANGLSPSIRDLAPEIPWRQIRGLRNILAHAYFSVDLAAVWTTATTDIPDLGRRTRALLHEVNPEFSRQFEED
jgi:uncharacterized protein with HEPN domain